MPRIQRALISVSDKTGIIEFAKALQSRKVEILSTGGTAKFLADNGVDVIEVSNYTQFPEIMGGRVKTLHPKIHGGLLGRRGTDAAVMTEQGIKPIDLLVVNLYPFEATIARPECDMAMAIENIDIGGPAMLRSAAKNHAEVVVIVNTTDYEKVLAEMMQNNCEVRADIRRYLAFKAFAHTARYDGMIANYLGQQFGDDNLFPAAISLQYQKVQNMRYGENPHQKAAFYVENHPPEPSVATAEQLQGKELSFNNIADTDAALECVKSFTEAPACVIVKHANPCGVAIGQNLIDAYNRAFKTDPTSAFGGIIAFNEPLDAITAQNIIERQFVEVIIAPAIAEEALPILAQKSNIRVLACGQWPTQRPSSFDFKRVNGGLLVQDSDLMKVTYQDLKVVSRRAPTNKEIEDMLLAWRVVKFVKSNAILYFKEGATLGIGAGQMSRVYSAKLAAMKAKDEGLQIQGSIMASDAFFPFRDGIDAAAEVGVAAVIQPGGSMRDNEVIAAADEHNIAMVFTGMRHFRH